MVSSIQRLSFDEYCLFLFQLTSQNILGLTPYIYNVALLVGSKAQSVVCLIPGVWLHILGSQILIPGDPARIIRGDRSWNRFYGHSPLFCLFKKGSCQLMVKVCVQVLVNRLKPSLSRKSLSWLIDWLNMILTVLTAP